MTQIYSIKISHIGPLWHLSLSVYGCDNDTPVRPATHANHKYLFSGAKWVTWRWSTSVRNSCSFFYGAIPLVGHGLLIIEASRSHPFGHTTIGRTPLDEWSARRRDLYLTTHNTHKRQTSRLPAGFEPAIPASGRPQTHALDRAVTWIGIFIITATNYSANESNVTSSEYSSVGTVTRLPAQWPIDLGSIPGKSQRFCIFCKTSKPALESTRTASSFSWVKWLRREAENLLLLEPRLRTSGAIPLHPSMWFYDVQGSFNFYRSHEALTPEVWEH
jgi:hypothetical protein